jgi:hypothetical protein
MQAGRMVQGLAMIRSEQDTRLEASVVQGSGEVTDPTRSDGTLQDLLRLEKDIVVGLADRLGYTLSEAERRAILENGTQNLAAFLAYSRALEAEDRGDYQAAARYYQQAVRSDPGFTQARNGLSATVVATEVETADASETPVLAGGVEAAEQQLGSVAEESADVASSTLTTTIMDLAPVAIEQTTAMGQGSTTGSNTNGAVGTTTAQPPPPSVVPPATVIGTIRIIFRLP